MYFIHSASIYISRRTRKKVLNGQLCKRHNFSAHRPMQSQNFLVFCIPHRNWLPLTADKSTRMQSAAAKIFRQITGSLLGRYRCRTYPAPCTMGTVSSPGVKAAGAWR